MLPELIDKQDGWEVVRDLVAAILVTETAAQKALAIVAAKPEPELWDMRIYSERSNAWEMFLNDPTDFTPVVNVWFDGADFSEGSGNVVERQKSETMINIDVFASEPSAETLAGHTPGDYATALAAQRACRLIRNILMSSFYTYLGARGVVWQRWLSSIKVFQPTYQGQEVTHVTGARLSLRVIHNEFSPQYVAETLESILVTVQRQSDGAVYLTAEFMEEGD